MKSRIISSLLAAALGCLTSPWNASAGDEPERHRLIAITIDGMRPEFYLSEPLSANCPTLKMMVQNGSAARAIFPPCPSFTYRAHRRLGCCLY